jgi:CubicO group peptidase (beta-lactamase class C family)
MTTVTVPPSGRPTRRTFRPPRARSRLDDADVEHLVREILSRRPTVGLAVGVIRGGRLDCYGHGLADVASSAPITEDTVFRIASVTKLVTAIAVMQLWETGSIDLDAPANDYLRAYRLVPAEAGFRPATMRHLLTHTSGIPEVVHLGDLFHPSWGSFMARPAALSVAHGQPLPSLAEYYRPGLRVVADPGSAFAYTNHGFATLGQIVEDVSGLPLDRYLREHVFVPLGMVDSHLGSGSATSRAAIGYELGSRGPRPIADRDWITRGASGVSASMRDMARFVAALLGGGANERGAVLRPSTLSLMFDPHWRPDPHIAGIGLGFFRDDEHGHRVVGHDGRMPGFDAALLLAPEDGVGVVGLTNGSIGAASWLPTEIGGLLRRLLDVPDPAVRTDLPHHPEIWGEVCGRYHLPARVGDLRARAMLGGGLEIVSRDGRLVGRILTPVPALYRGVPLVPDDEADPFVFRADLARFDLPPARLVFGRSRQGSVTAIHTDLGGQPLTLDRQPGTSIPTAGAAAGLATLAAFAALGVVRARRR